MSSVNEARKVRRAEIRERREIIGNRKDLVRRRREVRIRLGLLVDDAPLDSAA